MRTTAIPPLSHHKTGIWSVSGAEQCIEITQLVKIIPKTGPSSPAYVPVNALCAADSATAAVKSTILVIRRHDVVALVAVIRSLKRARRSVLCAQRHRPAHCIRDRLLSTKDTGSLLARERPGLRALTLNSGHRNETKNCTRGEPESP